MVFKTHVKNSLEINMTFFKILVIFILKRQHHGLQEILRSTIIEDYSPK